MWQNLNMVSDRLGKISFIIRNESLKYLKKIAINCQENQKIVKTSEPD